MNLTTFICFTVFQLTRCFIVRRSLQYIMHCNSCGWSSSNLGKLFYFKARYLSHFLIFWYLHTFISMYVCIYVRMYICKIIFFFFWNPQATFLARRTATSLCCPESARCCSSRTSPYRSWSCSTFPSRRSSMRPKNWLEKKTALLSICMYILPYMNTK